MVRTVEKLQCRAESIEKSVEAVQFEVVPAIRHVIR
jgi:hypothetical protein